MDSKMGHKFLPFYFSDLILSLHFRLCVHFWYFRIINCIVWNSELFSKFDIPMLRGYRFYLTVSKTFKLSISFTFSSHWSIYEFNL